MFGLALLPVGGAVAVAVEYNRATNLRAYLQAAADAAVLAAVAAPAGTEVDIANRQFQAHVATVRSGAVGPLVVTVTNAGGARTVRADFSAVLPLAFGGLIGRQSVDVGGKAVAGNATAGPPVYLDILAVLDVSASMTIAADTAGRDRLRALTLSMLEPKAAGDNPRGCAFACHQQGPQLPGTPTFATVAKANGIKTRGDVVRAELGSLMNQMEAASGGTGRLRMGLLTFSDTTRTSVPITTRYDDLRTALATVVDDDSTEPNSTFAAAHSAIGGGGTGAGPLDAKKAVLIVTDGVVGGRNGSIKDALNPSLCQSFKARGVEVFVINTTYVVLTGDWVYDNWVAPIIATVPPALRACASPGRYYEAGHPVEIAAAFANIFGVIGAQSRAIALSR